MWCPRWDAGTGKGADVATKELGTKCGLWLMMMCHVGSLVVTHVPGQCKTVGVWGLYGDSTIFAMFSVYLKLF